MSTVMEIKAAIERLPPTERAELEALVWPQLGASQADEQDTPPQVREKLSQTAGGRFLPGNRANIDKVLASGVKLEYWSIQLTVYGEVIGFCHAAQDAGRISRGDLSCRELWRPTEGHLFG